MPLKAFSFPFPETRFFKSGNFIYKFKIRGGTSYSEKKAAREDGFNQEMEEIIRTVVGNLDRLQPFSTNHFIVFPHKRRRDRMHKHSETKLRLYPFTIILYLEKKMHNGRNAAIEKKEVIRPRSKRCRRDSPLEEAILKDLVKDLEAESKKSVTGTVGLRSHHAEGQVNEDPALVDKPETSTDAEKKEGTPVRPGFLKRLASHIFPFFRSTTN